MGTTVIKQISTKDARFTLMPGEGADAVHTNPQYSFAVTELQADCGLNGTGLAVTMGQGNDLVCRAIMLLAETLEGREIEELMANFGSVSRALADHHQLRWLGPHKGVIHLALASITNACFDLWTKKRGVPLWRLLLDLTPADVVRLLDLSYLEDILTPEDALSLLESHQATRHQREAILKKGYPGYDTSVGWIGYDHNQVEEKVKQALNQGFRAVKLKVGLSDLDADVGRATQLRRVVGTGVQIMLDANQQWAVPKAIQACKRLSAIDPYWIEEPTHPDDVFGHQRIAQEIAPMRLAVGEHVPNRVVFKNYLKAGCVHFVQVDCVRVAGVSEFLAVSLLARKLGVPVVPHVGDLGQIHQHLVLFNHVAMGHAAGFLEYIPHLRERFVHPIQVRDGVYVTPQEPGSSSDLL